MDYVISEPCYEGTILQNKFVKFHGKKFWELQHDHVLSKSMFNEVCNKGTEL